MIFRCLNLCLLLSLSLYNYVNCKICQERQLYTYETTERRWRSEVEKYKTKCWLSDTTMCTKTRHKLVPTNITVMKQGWRTVSVCCQGYYTHEDSEEAMPDCTPICTPPCLNGYCQSPGVCACDDGYIPNPFNLFHCIPECAEDCEHGVCIAPNKCECLQGYTSIHGTCQAICTAGCINGNCVAPETCECSEGYRSENGTCKPYCEFCGTGSQCTGPGECSCDEGFEDNDDSCSPICPSGCNGGNCVAPNTCKCPAAYELNNGTCAPICPSCEHGHCELPFECICDTEYVLELGDNFEFSCQPTCTVNCGNGKCIAPDVCACASGYIANESCVPTCCEPYCSKGCNFGICTEPEFCECHSGYVKDFNTSECVPKCDYDCGGGKCVDPNTCHCDYGYGQNETAEFINEPICKPICKNCQGTCVAPYECVCDPKVYITVNVTEDGEMCNCFENCEDITSIECGKTICNEIVHVYNKDNLLDKLSMDISTSTIEKMYGTGFLCSSSGECSCDEGFEYINGSCNPICTNGCNGGICVGSNICVCPVDYRLNNGTCVPVCLGCDKGHCEFPFECTCDTGYVLELKDNLEFSCHPNCTVDCGNGKCIAPDVCACDSGYILKESCNPTCCEPYCSKGCNFGTCIEPEFCECNSGYVIDFNTSECVPKCDYDCGRGKCVDPNTCHCDYGYAQNETAEFINEPICKPICKNCQGTCVAPYECVCDPKVYITVNVTEDGEMCNCFENCGDITSIKCEKTICNEIVHVQRKDPPFDRTPIYHTMDIIRTTTIGDFSSSYQFTTEQYFYTTKKEFPTTKVTESSTKIIIPVNNEILPEEQSANEKKSTEKKFPSSKVTESSTKFIVVNNINFQERQRADAKSSPPVWIFFIVAAVLAVLVVTALVVILLKRMGYIGGSYIIENI